MEPTWNRTWEEKMYWGYFSTFHFAQFLLTDFETQLDIPEKFTANLKDKLPSTATLRGPTGVAWNVELVKIDDTLVFKHGWKQFVRDNSLRERDFLIFEYNGESEFNVLMFDGNSLCEKEATYFVREPGQSEERKETCKEIIVRSPSPDSDICLTTPTRRGSRIRRPTIAATKMNKDDDSNGDQSCAKRRKTSTKKCVPKRRPVTEEEIEKAMEAAKAEADDDSAIVVVRASSVCKSFHVVMTTDWLSEDQDVMLRCGGKTWCVRFNYIKARGARGFGAGWKKFVADNGLAEGDVCLFRIVPGSDTPIVLDVSFFRVVRDTNPPV